MSTPDPSSSVPAVAVPRPGVVPSRRWLLWLTALALLTRLVWVLVVHPPGNYVFSDMNMYVKRATDLAVHGPRSGVRDLAWQAFGTHYLLAGVFKIFGPGAPYRAAAVVWGLLGAAAVPLTYLLACRVLPTARLAAIAGVLALVWYPNLSTTGFFLSETPFLCAQLLSAYWLVRVVQEGKMAWAAGVASALCFMLRPQSALFFVLVFGLWLVNVRGLPWVRLRQLVGVGLPLIAALAFSVWRYHSHTGRWDGIAENANMNLTAGRCHNIVTQAFKKKADLDRSARANNTNDGRRVSLPSYRTLQVTFPPGHPLALNPAMEGETIRFVGYIGDPWIHRDLRRECYRRTGLIGQLQYSVVNLLLQWFISRQWPDNAKNRQYFLPPSEVFRYGFQIFVLVPSLLGVGLGLARLRRTPATAVLALCLFNSMLLAAVFFGDVRLRTPYDPYAIILALLAVHWLLTRWRARRAQRA
ncbi:MAG: hypothetical protein IPO88_05635 [Nannocystis sp.]|nr:hypothetical protein [Nannocystis sp.]MBK9752982.1 hypothetical protein [Nannocystis sp.]